MKLKMFSPSFKDLVENIECNSKTLKQQQYGEFETMNYSHKSKY